MVIPERFLPRVMADLVGAGLVIGRRGRTGGYRLARPAEQITLLDIISAAEPEPGRSRVHPSRRPMRGRWSLCRPRRLLRRARRRCSSISAPLLSRSRSNRPALTLRAVGPGISGPFGSSVRGSVARVFTVLKKYGIPFPRRGLATMRRTTVISIVIVAIAAITAGCTSATGATWTFPPNEQRSAAPAPTSSEPAPSSGSAAVRRRARDRGLRSRVHAQRDQVDAPGRYEVTLNNTGTIPHDVTFPDGSTSGMVDGADTATFEVDVPAEGLTFICSIPGHAQAGMEGAITVKGGATAGGDDHGGPAPDHGRRRGPERPGTGHLRRDGAGPTRRRRPRHRPRHHRDPR